MIPQSRRRLLWLMCCGLISSAVLSCASTNPPRTPAVAQVANTQIEKAPVNRTPVIHVFVALADNVNQGIVPVSATLGNGDNAATNLYWGAAFGIKTFFNKNKDWQAVNPANVSVKSPSVVLDRKSTRLNSSH